MATWIFDTEKRDEALTSWVEEQKATGHPGAIANADFVAGAIVDFLESNESLFKTPPSVDIKPITIIDDEDINRLDAKETKSQEREAKGFSIDEMLNQWNNTK